MKAWRWPCWLGGHTPMLTTEPRGATRVVRWVCRHCLKDLGETTVLTWTPADPRRAPRARRRDGAR